MDKKQKAMFGTILLILIIISLLIGYTFAKYYSSYEGNSELKVAKWSFKVDGWSTSETKQISLIDTADKVDLEDGKIAPGFEGNVELQLDATDSEVDVEYYVEAKEFGHKPSNLFFKAKIDGELTESYSTLEELATKELKGTILKSDSQKIKNIEIYCIWPYETGVDEQTNAVEDAEDTNAGLGTVEGQEDVFDYTFSLKIIGTQAKTTN